MNATFKLVSSLVSLMQVRQNYAFTEESVKRAHHQEWEDALQRASGQAGTRQERALIAGMVGAMQMQDRREAGEFHVTQEAALSIWNLALKAGEDYLATPQVSSLPTPAELDAERSLKQRADAMGRAMSKFNVSLKHGQLLTVVARMEGRTSFQALKSALEKSAPNFCPHCGATATLKSVDSVYCEQGDWDGKSYEGEGSAAQYACSRCNGQFLDWGGISVSQEYAEGTSAAP
jgi:hypothetical protein